MEPRRLRASLDALSRQIGLPPPGDLDVAMAAWDEAAGRLARRSRPQLLRADVLVVDADDAATAEALRWSAERILGALESSGGRRIARTLEVRVRPAGGPGSPTGGW